MSGLAAKGRDLKVEANECPTPNDALLSAGQVSGNTSWALDSSLEASTAVEVATTTSAIQLCMCEQNNWNSQWL